MARKFFVGGHISKEMLRLSCVLISDTGNFKMNGSKESLTKLVAALNGAELNPDVGQSTISVEFVDFYVGIS